MGYKILWGIRFVLMYFLWKKCGFPGYIGKPIFLMGLNKVNVGSRVRIFPGLRLEVHEGGTLNIGGNVSIGQNLHMTSGKKIGIGSGSVITANVVITDIDHEYKQVGKPVLEQGLLLSETVIGENCFIGSGAIIQAGTVLGDHCVVGANSVVHGSFLSGSVIVGAPARVMKQYRNGEWERVLVDV